MSIISQYLVENRTRKPRIAILGDLMIDEYYKVDVKRISPEAPIPVMRSDNEEPIEIVPGGAANVAYQLKNWNVECTLFGILSQKDLNTLHYLNIVPVVSPNRIPIKKRFQDGQNLIRWDIETVSFEINEDDRKKLLEVFEEEIKKNSFEIAVLSDYGKGAFGDFKFTQDIITICHTHGIKIIVDPKDEPIEKWIGCNIFKPNSIEAELFTDVKDPKLQCQRIAEKLSGTNVVITYGGRGVTGMLVDGNIFSHKPNLSTQAISVIGAGDSFVSHLALAVSHNFSLPEAVEIAYKAGVVYVQKEYNKPVYPYELIESKFIHPCDLQKRDFKLVSTNGCYDLGLHLGHISTFQFAKSKGDKLVVLVNSDESVRKLKGEGRPIIPLEQRLNVIAALECVDFIIPFNDDSPFNTIKCMGGTDVLVKGGDYQGGKINSSELAKEVYFAPFIEGASTTQTIEKIVKSYKNL